MVRGRDLHPIHPLRPKEDAKEAVLQMRKAKLSDIQSLS